MRELEPLFEYTDLPEEWQNTLAHLPEHGMGYQYVDIVMRDNIIHRNIVAVGCRTLVNIRIDPKNITAIYLSPRG